MLRELSIAGTRIGDDTPAWIVAEVGTNHGGSVKTCMDLIAAAAECGVNAVKLQKRDNKTLFTREMYDTPYNSEHAFGPTYGLHREALELDFNQYSLLKEYAEALGLVFFATAFDCASADFLNRLGVFAYKIASGDLRNIPLIQHVAKFGRPVIVSTGGGTLDDLQRLRDEILPVNRQIAILQCTAAYPVQPAEMNLRVIDHYRVCLPDTVIGLSDHQDGISMGPVAYTLGARIFEKHFTLNHTWKGSDHAFSLEPDGLKRFVRDVHRTREALGDGVKQPYESEKGPLYKMAKCLVAANDLAAGRTLRHDDIAIKSPCIEGALLPYQVSEAVGCILLKSLAADAPITQEVLGSD